MNYYHGIWSLWAGYGVNWVIYGVVACAYVNLGGLSSANADQSHTAAHISLTVYRVKTANNPNAIDFIISFVYHPDLNLFFIELEIFMAMTARHVMMILLSKGVHHEVALREVLAAPRLTNTFIDTRHIKLNRGK